MQEIQLAKNTFKVFYNDGSEVIVKPVSWRLLEDVELLTQEIFVLLLEQDGNFGELFKPNNRKFWEFAGKLAEIMPVVGQTSPGIDLNKIDDLDQLVRIFITTSDKRHPVTGGLYAENGQGLPPSEIYRINSLNFFTMLEKAQETLRLLQDPPPKKTSKSKAAETQKQT